MAQLFQKLLFIPNKIKIINKQFISQKLTYRFMNILLFIVKRQWDIYRPVKLRQYCKFSKLFMYLKRAGTELNISQLSNGKPEKFIW